MSKIHDALKKARYEQNSAIPTTRTQAVSPHPSSAVATPSLGEVVSDAAPSVWTPQQPNLLFSGGRNPPLHLEAFRRLRSQLYLYARTRTLKTVVMVSAIPGEGKTFLTANLGMTLARQKGKKVLLIDGDLRQGSLSSLLGARIQPGLVEYLKGKVGLREIVQRGPEGDLYLISAGKRTGQAAELLQGNALRLALAQLGKVFDWIILDSPAALPVSDVNALAACADGVLVVARAGVTNRDLVRKVTGMFPEQVLGVVLNGVRRGDVYSEYEYPGYLKFHSE